MSSRVEAFDYELPQDLIAQKPAERRDASRLLVLERSADGASHRRFDELAELLRAGDLLVVNDARVLPARLYARRATGGRIELLLLEAVTEQPPRWRALVRPGRRAPIGEQLAIDDAIGTRVVAIEPSGTRVVEFDHGVDVPELLDRLGIMPLPPYIHAPDTPERQRLDRSRYQTVYAKTPGAVAAPTAGLHFTADLLARLAESGVKIARLTLHVGAGTFRPIATERVGDHEMEPERYSIPAETVDAIEATRQAGGRIVAVGTTVVRALEHGARRGSTADPDGESTGAAPVTLTPGDASADLFITPGFRFRVVDAMITNFHLPRSTPLLMLAAFVGRDRLLATYRVAVERGYRFYSYGDAMLVLP